MFWNIIAVFTAGLAGFGILHLIRRFFRRLPRWSLPAGAGIAMLLMQITLEYQWYPAIRMKLPAGSSVLAAHQARDWWRPWSYVYPVVDRFIVLAPERGRRGEHIEVMLYFLAKNEPAHPLQTAVDCAGKRQNSGSGWEVQPYTDALTAAVCAQ